MSVLWSSNTRIRAIVTAETEKQLTARKETEGDRQMLTKRSTDQATGAVNPETNAIGKESVPKIIINDTVNLFFLTAIGVLLISNHNNSFRVLLDKIASVYFV